MASSSSESSETQEHQSIESKKVVVFGGTGRTGRPLIEQALAQGHRVTAVVRTPEKLDIKHENLEVVKGDIMDIESYANTFKDKDAILSAFGSPYHSVFNPTTMYSESMKGILVAMKRHNLKRLIVITSWGTKSSPDNSWFVEWFLRPFLLGGILNDMGVMEDMLVETKPDEVNYTIIRPCGLTEEPAQNNYVVEEGLYSNSNSERKIPRADVADFMLKCLNSNQYDRKVLAIAGKKALE